jgi:hypothetical protein
MRAIIHPCLAIVSVFLASISMGDAAETYTTIEKASPIYRLQGEYMGVIDAWGGTWGAQAIAKGESKLEVHLLQGGLPGLGFTDRKPTKTLDAEIDIAKLAYETTVDSLQVSMSPESIAFKDSDGKKVGVLTKVVRESSTLGAKPPANAIVLFAVKGPNNFQDAKLTDEGFLRMGCTSKELFRDHHLHIEFCTPFQPDDRGQKRGNSGVYLQGRFELQVLDSFGLAGENNECGGIYSIARPRVNMCYPPLTWQTYDIDFTAARYDESGKKIAHAKITAKHNGVLIHDQQELPHDTPGGSKEGKDAGPLFLQDHNNPVVYRNIWAVHRP